MRPGDVHCPTAALMGQLLRPLRRYHRHQVAGLQHLPRQGAALLVVHHSFATYDIPLLGLAAYEATGRMPHALVDRRFFRLPAVGALVHRLGSVEGRPDHGAALLARGKLVVVAPGGMREALRPSSAPYALAWGQRQGFARLAMQAQVPVLVAACAGADAIYSLYDNPLTRYCLARHHLPVPLLRGLGPSLLPRPVALQHVILPAILPPAWPTAAAAQAAAVQAFAGHIATTMQGLLHTFRRRQAP